MPSPFRLLLVAGCAGLLATSATAAPSTALGHLAVGEPFLDDWTVVAARPAFAGGVRLTLDHGGARVRVDVVRRDASPRAPVFSDALELYVMNGADGDEACDPDLHDALEVLLEQLGDDDAQARIAATLLTHDQRLDRFPRLMRRAEAREAKAVLRSVRR